jgi:glutamate-1-semialdehyde 2,1-aminomutase
VAVCGYHGWQDWFIGSTARNRGVPKATRDLTHSFAYNDPDSLEKLLQQHPGEFAAVILEPMNVAYPKPGFLEGLRSLTRKHGALLIFDETITGFRFANGGAQQYFNVEPDLATFGKGLANGYPVSAVAGKAEYMKLMEEVFFSFTFGGETLSLAASLATMNKLQREPVIETLWKQGKKIMDGAQKLVEKHGASHFLSVAGSPTWSFLVFKDVGPATQWQMKTLFLQETLKRGILSVCTHNLSYSHSDSDVARLLEVYDEVFPMIRQAVDANDFPRHLKCKPLGPLFKVR